MDKLDASREDAFSWQLAVATGLAIAAARADEEHDRGSIGERRRYCRLLTHLPYHTENGVDRVLPSSEDFDFLHWCWLDSCWRDAVGWRGKMMGVTRDDPPTAVFLEQFASIYLDETHDEYIRIKQEETKPNG